MATGAVPVQVSQAVQHEARDANKASVGAVRTYGFWGGAPKLRRPFVVGIGHRRRVCGPEKDTGINTVISVGESLTTSAKFGLRNPRASPPPHPSFCATYRASGASGRKAIGISSPRFRTSSARRFTRGTARAQQGGAPSRSPSRQMAVLHQRSAVVVRSERRGDADRRRRGTSLPHSRARGWRHDGQHPGAAAIATMKVTLSLHRAQ